MKPAILIAALVLATLPLPSRAQPPAGYKLAWSDEFDGQSLDMSKWSFHNPGKRRDAINVPEAVRLDGKGHAVLTTSRVMVDGKPEYHTVMLQTRGKFERTFGYWEARMQLQTQEGHWSAFWLMPTQLGKPVGDPGKGGVEVDIMEYLTRWGDATQHTLHWDGYGKDHKSTHGRADVPGLSKGLHTFGVLWTKDEYVFFIDGRQTWKTSKAVSHRPEYALVSLEVGKWAGDIAKAKLPDSILVDYVRWYAPPEDAGAAK